MTAARAVQTGGIEDAYKQAVANFAGAVELLHKGDMQAALSRFEQIEKDNPDEPVLAERARTYQRVCRTKLAGDPAPPASSEDRYLAAVIAINDGRQDEAIELLNSALTDNPASGKVFYARASAYALKGHTDASVADLRQCIAIDPTIRFHAINDPDFEKIREEPAFIDIIEPTSAGG